MPRIPRIVADGIPHHVLNRINGRLKVFSHEQDYAAFEKIIEEAHEIFKLPILAYILMPNHWHFIVQPENGNLLSSFMRWITQTHTQRYRVYTQTTGEGHLYQGRFKSFPIEKDDYLLTAIRYVERNALRAGLVKRAESWKHSSLWRRIYGKENENKILTKWPVPIPDNYLDWINDSITEDELRLKEIRYSVTKNKPFGDSIWVSKITKRFGIETRFRERGRPKKCT